MSKRKKTLTLDEIFCGMPRLREYLKTQAKGIKKMKECAQRNDALILELEEKHKALVETARGMRAEDLQILYYIHTLEGVRSCRVLNALRRLSAAQTEFKNSLQEQNENKDIM